MNMTRNKYSIRAGLFFLLLVVSSFSFAETSVWKVSKGQSHIFIGGTIHVLRTTDYPLPQAFENAYQQSDKLVFETDIDTAAQPQFAFKMLAQMAYKNGRTLRDDLKPETITALEKYAGSAGLPMAALLGLKPPMVSLTLTMTELQRLGINAPGVDAHFSQKATQDGKSKSWLESLDEQLSFIKNMGKGQEDQLILHTLEENEEMAKLMGELDAHWKAGNLQQLDELAIKPMLEQFPGIYDTMLANRNNRWMPEIEKLFTTPDVEYVLVGALHLAGRDGLITQLQQRGYTIEQW